MAPPDDTELVFIDVADDREEASPGPEEAAPEATRLRWGRLLVGCTAVVLLASVGLGAVMVAMVLWDQQIEAREPLGYRTSSFTAFYDFECGRADCPWKHVIHNDTGLVVVQQELPNAALLAPGGYQDGAIDSSAKLTMGCVKGQSGIELYVWFDLPAPRRVLDMASVTLLADRNRRPQDDVLARRMGRLRDPSAHHMNAHTSGAKAGEFQLLFESDQMIRDWLNAWSLWIVVELDNGWKAGGIFDLLHSTRHTQDLIDMCGL